MSTVALNMIVKDEYDEVMAIVAQAQPFFDEINLTISDKEVSSKLALASRKVENMHVQYRAWNNRFDEARNQNFAMSHCDYNFWIDCDDIFDFRAIPKLVELMDENEYDQILLPYNYAQDENGVSIAMHWRERLLRATHPFYWKGWIHETPITDKPFKAHRVNVEVRHNAAPDHVHESIERNHKILLEAASASDDPRYLLYLGTSHRARGDYGEAIAVLDEYLKVSGSAEDAYRALCCMSECAWQCKYPNKALEYAAQASVLIPSHPQAYFLLAQWETEQSNWKEGLEWIKTSEVKADPTDLSVFDPTSRSRVYLMAAQCEFMQKNYNNALAWLRKVSPDDPNRQDLEDDFITEADAETFITMLPKMRKFFKSDTALYNSLCRDLQFDTRTRGLRELVTEPNDWHDKSIVILCGQGYEEWGPHTLDKGMGGSEEAVVYLSRELARLGWDVTVFGAVEETILDQACTDPQVHTMDKCQTVVYRPWQEFDRRDEFNVFIGWRAPNFSDLIKAKVKIADIHDALPAAEVKNYPDVTYFVKTNFHRSLYPHIPDSKFKVIGNGIRKDQFDEKN